MKRILIIALLALVATVSANAQYVRYKDIKKDYNTKDYFPQVNDPYSPTWSSVLGFFVPGSSQLVMHETTRGLLFLGGSAICSYIVNEEINNLTKIAVVDENNTITGFSDQDAAVKYSMVLIGTALVDLGLSIWSCIDAGKIAKTKNMYYQDLCGKSSAIQMNVAPSFALTPVQGGSYQPTAGMSLSLNF